MRGDIEFCVLGVGGVIVLPAYGVLWVHCGGVEGRGVVNGVVPE